MMPSGSSPVQVDLSNNVNINYNDDINGVLWGYKWDTTALTFAFPDAAADYGSYTTINGFQAFNNAQEIAIDGILQKYQSVCGLTFAFTTDDANANLRFAMATTLDYGDGQGLHVPGGANKSAEGNPPDTTQFQSYQIGDCWFNTTSYNTPLSGDFAYTAGLMHEIGHALGLKHGHASQTAHGATFPVLPSNHNSSEYSVMTYATFVGDSTTDGDNAINHATTPMQDDIAALQYMYGANYNTNNTDTVYTWSTATGEEFINGVGQGKSFDNAGNPSNVVFLTVWDGGGTDTYDFSNYATNLSVDLNPGAWTILDTSANQVQRADLDSNKTATTTDDVFARGNIANALLDPLLSNEAFSLIENAKGGSGDDTILGNVANNVLDGGPGHDTLNGGGGIDTASYLSSPTGVNVSLGPFHPFNPDILISIENLTGSNFDDTLVGDGSNNVLDGLGGNDSLFGAGSTDSLHGGDGDDTLNSGGGGDVLDGGAGSDTASYAGAPAGVTADLQNPGNNTGNAAFETYISIENLLGSSFADTLQGDQNANVLTGGDGDDTLNGGAGLDTLIGGNGNDNYFITDSTLVGGGIITFRDVLDSVVENAGGGIDTVEVERIVGTLRTFTNYTLGANVENGIVIGSDDFDLTGNALNNTLIGNAGINTLTGGDGNDFLNGGAGLDTLIGGNGDDTYVIADSTLVGGGIITFRDVLDSVVENANAGIDTVEVERIVGALRTFTSYTLGANVENGIVIGSDDFDLTGNALNNTLIGNVGANTLTGGDGNDTLSGGSGLDTLVGGNGDDTYFITDSTFVGGGVVTFRDVLDSVVEDANAGIDTVEVERIVGTLRTFTSYTLGANVENGIVIGSDDFSLTGNALNNALSGNGAVNALSGGDGNDTLLGGAGSDSLDGGTGADHMTGGTGDDTYVVDNAGDVVTEKPGEGTDAIETTLAVFSLANLANIENLRFIGAGAFTGIGNAVANTITGGAGNDVLNGQGGADTLIGGTGNDFYVVDNSADQVIEAAGEGNDSVLTSVSYTLGAGQSIEALSTTSAAATTNLSLTGNALAQTIVGNAGNNVLNDGGTGGHDALKGLGGNDRYVVANTGDIVIESANGGTDQVLTSASFTLGAGQSVEFLLTSNSAGLTNINLAGNALAQTIIGNAGGNILNDGGAGGIDTLEGLGGNDSYVVNNAGDHVVEAAGAGSDTVRTSVSFTLTAGQSIEAFTPTSYAGTTSLNLTGNTLAQTIIGNAGSNILNDGGAGGDDTLQGLGGNDSYVVNNSSDIVLEAANGGSDTVRTSASFTLGAGQSVETLTPVSYASTAAINLTGNALGQTIIGNAGNNVIDGAAGSDTLEGLGGNDTFVFNTALNAATNVDSMLDFTHGTDKIELDHAIFTALAAANPLPAADFTTGTPTNANQHIVYNTTTGALSYDDDGNGAHAAVQFATLTTHPALANTDIFVV